MKNTKVIKLIILLCAAMTIVIIFSGIEQSEPVENLTIVVGSGYDIEKVTSDNVVYKVSRSTYVFENTSSVINRVLTGTSMSIGEARQDRQTKLDKLDILGLDKTFVISEETAYYGIKPIVDILYKNSMVSNNSNVSVCKGKAITLLKFKIPNYPSSSDYIDGLIRSAKDHNFFSREYTLSNLFVRAGAEGRNIVLPYIEIKKEEYPSNESTIEITGSALFKKYNMITKLNIDDTRIMNLLRENNVKGILKIQDSSKKFVEYYGKSKRKVKCSKEGDKYIFTINIDLTGDVITNQLLKDLNDDLNVKKELENNLAQVTEKQCYEFIDKMKNVYKIDCLELGRTAASKYGRRTGVDWNEIISKSDIKVDVKVHLDKQGRGHFM